MDYQNKNIENSLFLEKEILKKQKAFLLQRKREIQKLEYKINHPIIANLKNNVIRKFFLSFRMGKIIIPYIITTSISFGTFASFDKTPFIKDDQKKKIEVEKKLENWENVNYVLKEEPIDGSLAVISYFENWEKSTDFFYSRKVKTYIIDHFQEEMLTIKNGTPSFFDESFFNPTFFIIETNYPFIVEPLKKEAYFQVIIYYNDFIIVKETNASNIAFTIIWILVTLLANYILKNTRKNASLLDFHNYIQKLKREYPKIDMEEVSKKLEIKKSNYDRLTR